MQLDTSEVQLAITEYLRKRGVIVEDVRQVQLRIISAQGEWIRIGGCEAVVVANNVKLPDDGPYR